MAQLNFNLPIRTVETHAPVKILTTEGRSQGLPVIGYVGDDSNLCEWSLEGKGPFHYHPTIENTPFEVEVWLLITKGGRVYKLDNEEQVKTLVGDAGTDGILSVARHLITVPCGQRDDLK